MSEYLTTKSAVTADDLLSDGTGRMLKGLPMTNRKCVNGCDADVCPPSKVVCRKCLDTITAKMAAILANMERRTKRKRENEDGK